MSPIARRTAIPLVCLTLAAVGLLAPGRSDASPPAGFSAPHQVRTLTSCIGQSATAADGTDVVYSEGGHPNDVTFHALVRRPGTAGWIAVPSLHVPAYSFFDQRMVAIGKSDVLLALAWYDSSDRPAFTLYRLATRRGTWSAPIKAFPRADNGYYEDAAVGVTAAGGLVAATTHTTYDASSYHYAVKVAYRAPGSTTWHRQTYSSGSSWMFIRDLAVSKNGYAVVSFLQEDAASPNAQTAAGVISRSPGSATWRFQPLDLSGHVARVAVAVGADGEALYVSSQDNGHTVHLARTVLPHGDSLPSWSLQDVTTMTTYTSDQVFAAVDGHEHGTVVIDDHTPPLYAHLHGDTITGVQPLDNGASRDVYDFAVRPDGVAVAAVADFSTGGTPVFTGSDAIAFRSDGSSSARPLESAGVPWSNGHRSIALGFDAASRAFATFTTGDPTPDECQYVDQPAEPDVVTSPSSGRYVTHTRTQRLAHDRLRCVSGFWVEARSLSYRWYRSGKLIGTTGSVHKLVAADQGHRLTCRVLATNRIGTRSLGP